MKRGTKNINRNPRIKPKPSNQLASTRIHKTKPPINDSYTNLSASQPFESLSSWETMSSQKWEVFKVWMDDENDEVRFSYNEGEGKVILPVLMESRREYFYRF